MRSIVGLVCGVVAAATMAGAADAAVKVKSKTIHYSISGKTGGALLDAMDRKGPKQGLLARAIAQTGYTIEWNIDWREKAGRCRIAASSAVLNITYNYPEVSGSVAPALERRWKRFMSGVQQHENNHGRLARQMVNAAERSIRGLGNTHDRGCAKTRAEVKRRVDAVYADYEARQVEFDRVEHAPGGHVEALVTALSRPN